VGYLKNRMPEWKNEKKEASCGERQNAKVGKRAMRGKG